jgi:hypothetical protein
VAGCAPAASAFALALALAGCDVAHPGADLDAPRVKLTHVQAATGIGDDGFPSTYQDLDPQEPMAEVVLTSSIKLRFDRFLLPAETFRQSICVQSDPKPVKSAKDCTAGIYFEPAYDPLYREITFRQSEDMGKEHLQPGTNYVVTVFPPSGDASDGIQAFDGAALDRVYTFRFTTAEVPPPEPNKFDKTPDTELFCSSVVTFLSSCSFTNCHLNTKDSITKEIVGAAEGLDMSSVARIIATAINDTAHGSQTGEHARKADRSPPRFGKAMPIIDPNFPGNSYILYKLLSNPLNLAVLEDPPSDAEVARLRAGAVVGMPMPPGTNPPLYTSAADADKPQKQAEYRASIEALSTWILQGAPTVPQCPPAP